MGEHWDALIGPYLNWKNRQISQGVRIARHELSETYNFVLPHMRLERAVPQTRIERRAYRLYQTRYLRRTMRSITRERQRGVEAAVREAEKIGYIRANQRIGSVVAYLESIGAPQGMEPDDAMAMVTRVLSGYRERNDMLESKAVEDDALLRRLGSMIEEERRLSEGLKQELWLANAEIRLRRDLASGSNITLSAGDSGETGPGAGPSGEVHHAADPADNDLRAVGVDQASI